MLFSESFSRVTARGFRCSRTISRAASTFNVLCSVHESATGKYQDLASSLHSLSSEFLPSTSQHKVTTSRVVNPRPSRWDSAATPRTHRFVKWGHLQKLANTTHYSHIVKALSTQGSTMSGPCGRHLPLWSWSSGLLYCD